MCQSLIPESHFLTSRKALIVFLRYPEHGKVKSRLAREVGNEKAVAVYETLTRQCLGKVHDFHLLHPEVHLFIYFDPPEKGEEARKAFPGPWRFSPQGTGHMGEKMASAFRDVFEAGYKQAVLIGTDIADLSLGDLKAAFQGLEKNQAVLGPAHDGGYYLIGLALPFYPVFDDLPWSTPAVYEKTLKYLSGAGIQVGHVALRRDVDEGKDVAFMQGRAAFQNRLSVIVPYLDENAQLESLVERLMKQVWPGDEVVLVKGVPLPVTIVEDPASQVVRIQAPKGRGIQMNRGVQEARGDILWFLHADSVPPPNFGYHVRKMSVSKGYSLGCFELRYMGETRHLQWISRWANWRTRHLNLPYGDQGLFCTRRLFAKAGGFRKHFLMEDIDFVRVCRRFGRLLKIPVPIYSSPKRYVEGGLLRVAIQNNFLMLLYLLGVNDQRLYRIYYGIH